MSAEGQLDLYTREDPRWVSVRDEAKIGVAIVTLKDFAYRCDASPSGLSDALAERQDKRLAARHLVVLIDMLPPANRLALVRKIAGPDFCVERAVTLTPEDEARIMREFIASKVPGLLPELMKAIGR